MLAGRDISETEAYYRASIYIQISLRENFRDVNAVRVYVAFILILELSKNIQNAVAVPIYLISTKSLSHQLCPKPLH